MTAALKIQLREDLVKARSNAGQRMAALRDELLTLDSRGDFADRNWSAAERRRLAENIVSTHEQILEIEDAFHGILSGTYGQCCECEEPIQERRLLYQPWSRRCLSCQQRWERGVRPHPLRGPAETLPGVQAGA